MDLTRSNYICEGQLALINHRAITSPSRLDGALRKCLLLTRCPPTHDRLLRTPLLHESSLSRHIMAIRQMRLQNHIPIRTNVIAIMAINADLVGRNALNRHLLVWIAEKNDGVDEFGSIFVGTQKRDTVVHDLAALAVAADGELGVGTLGHGLLDELERFVSCVSCVVDRVYWRTEAKFSAPVKLPPRQ